MQKLIWRFQKMKKTRLLALLLALCMVAALFAACGNTEPEETTDTTAATSADTTTAGDTSADTSADDTSDTEPTVVDLNGYEFTMHAGGLLSFMEGDDANTERGAKLQDGVAAIEEKLNCVITFTDGGASDNMEKIATAATAGDYIYDLIKARQSTWIPATMGNMIWAMDELADQYGLDIYNEDVCNQ
ncbi:MAG: hypothetical protein ACI4XQ_00920, partial [Eubacteriales bacterium]